MGFNLKRSADFPGCLFVDMADPGKEEARAEEYANTRCFMCDKIIGLRVAFLRIDGRLAHNGCVQPSLL